MKIQFIVVSVIVIFVLVGCVILFGYSSGGYNNGYNNGGYGNNGGYNQGCCVDCGIVICINIVFLGCIVFSVIGVIFGGIVGVVVGYEIFDYIGGSCGNKNIVVVVGVVGGVLVGNQIQKNVISDIYDISVCMDDGCIIVVNQCDLGGICENIYVCVVNGKVILC